MGTEPQGGPLTFLAELVIDAINLARSSGNTRAAKAAERENRRAEEESRRRRRAQLAAVQRQAARRSAGNASEAEAHAALAGKRRNLLEGRRFR
jgi:hypothetical protein